MASEHDDCVPHLDAAPAIPYELVSSTLGLSSHQSEVIIILYIVHLTLFSKVMEYCGSFEARYLGSQRVSRPRGDDVLEQAVDQILVNCTRLTP